MKGEELIEFIIRALGLNNDRKPVLYAAKMGTNKLVLSTRPLDDILRLQEDISNDRSYR